MSKKFNTKNYIRRQLSALKRAEFQIRYGQLKPKKSRQWQIKDLDSQKKAKERKAMMDLAKWTGNYYSQLNSRAKNSCLTKAKKKKTVTKIQNSKPVDMDSNDVMMSLQEQTKPTEQLDMGM